MFSLFFFGPVIIATPRIVQWWERGMMNVLYKKKAARFYPGIPIPNVISIHEQIASLTLRYPSRISS